jgi:hypothetical protein
MRFQSIVLSAALVWSVVVAGMASLQIGHLARPQSFFDSPNFLGGYAACMFFLAAHSAFADGMAKFSLAANLVSLALSQSRGAILALGAGLAVMLARRTPWLATMAALAMFDLALTLRRDYAELRWTMWSEALAMIAQRPLGGWGFMTPHYFSIPLEWTVWTGAPGLAIAGWLYIVLLCRAWRISAALAAMLVAWLVQGCFTYLTPTTALIFIGTAAYIAGYDDTACSGLGRGSVGRG